MRSGAYYHLPGLVLQRMVPRSIPKTARWDTPQLYVKKKEKKKTDASHSRRHLIKQVQEISAGRLRDIAVCSLHRSRVKHHCQVLIYKLILRGSVLHNIALAQKETPPKPLTAWAQPEPFLSFPRHACHQSSAKTHLFDVEERLGQLVTW